MPLGYICWSRFFDSLDERTRSWTTLAVKFFGLKRKTYPADCQKIAAVDSSKQDWDWKNRYWKKKIFVQKHFLSPIYFDGIS